MHYTRTAHSTHNRISPMSTSAPALDTPGPRHPNLPTAFWILIGWIGFISALISLAAGLHIGFRFSRRARTTPPGASESLDIEKSAIPTKLTSSDSTGTLSGILDLYTWVSTRASRLGRMSQIPRISQPPCLLVTSPSLNLKDILTDSNFSTHGGLASFILSDDRSPGFLTPKTAHLAIRSAPARPRRNQRQPLLTFDEVSFTSKSFRLAFNLTLYQVRYDMPSPKATISFHPPSTRKSRLANARNSLRRLAGR